WRPSTSAEYGRFLWRLTAGVSGTRSAGVGRAPARLGTSSLRGLLPVLRVGDRARLPGGVEGHPGARRLLQRRVGIVHAVVAEPVAIPIDVGERTSLAPRGGVSEHAVIVHVGREDRRR